MSTYYKWMYLDESYSIYADASNSPTADWLEVNRIAIFYTKEDANEYCNYRNVLTHIASTSIE